MSLKVYTSYYANPALRNLPDGVITASVSNTKPEWFTPNYEWKVFAPKWADINRFKNGLYSFEEFFEAYINSLETQFSSTKEIRDYVVDQVGEDATVVLLCWEKDPGNCHRGMLSVLFGEESKGEYSTQSVWN